MTWMMYKEFERMNEGTSEGREASEDQAHAMEK